MTAYRTRREAGEFEAPAEGVAAPAAAPDSGDPLDAMTKDELLAHAQALGVSPANAAMTKAELREAIEAA